MGRNRKMASPEAYPAAFIAAIRDGAGLIYAEDLPWTTISAAKRFRLCLALLRDRKDHPLHQQALKRWSVRAGSRALEVAVDGRGELAPGVGAALVAKALST